MFIESFARRLSSVSSFHRYNHHRCGCANELRKRSIRDFSYSRMLDMGGTPSINSDQSLIRTVNASKNSRLQAVAFDFQTLINIDGGNKNVSDELASAEMILDNSAKKAAEQKSRKFPSVVDGGRVSHVAALLNFDLSSSTNDTKSNLTDVAKGLSQESKNALESALKNHNPNIYDIRAKYASKLKGGLVGIELAKSQVEETLTSGDAAGHLVARKVAIMDDTTSISNGKSNVSKRWLPSSAATQLLSSLTHRSIRIVLLPTLNAETTEDEPRMEDFRSQLKNVIIDNIVPKFDDDESEDRIGEALRKGVLNNLDVDPIKVLLVSQRDSYLRVARDLGMNICRLQPENARRGSITAHYTVQTIEEVQDIVNEINGISFNIVLNR